MGSQKSSPKFQNAAKARQWVAWSDSLQGDSEKPPCRAAEGQHPGLRRGKLKRGYTCLQWQNWKGKTTRGGAQTSQLEPQVQNVELQGLWDVCLFVLMSLVLLCTSQNGDLQVQWETLNEKKKMKKKWKRHLLLALDLVIHVHMCRQGLPPPPSFSLPLPGILLPPSKLKNS